MSFIPSSVPKLPLSMEPSRGKIMKSDNPAPDSKFPDLGAFEKRTGNLALQIIEKLMLFSCLIHQ